MELTYQDFVNGQGPSSYRGRIASKDKMSQLSRKVAFNHAYRPTNAQGISQFLRLKQADANDKVSVSTAYQTGSNSGGSGWTSKLMGDESAELLKEIENRAAQQFVQNFYNAYMAPANSDIVYRLGTVTKTKHNSGFYDSTGKMSVTSDTMYDANGNLIANKYNSCEVLGQTDKFGRIDTVSNLRMQVDVNASSIKLKDGRPLTPGYSEYYVNWYFPPYNASAFDVAGINRANLAAARREANKQYKVSVAAATNEFEKAIESMVDMANRTKTASLSEDKSSIPTFDPIDLMCARDGFTYRTAGYKAINDNISLLQHIFEECTGIVSTYLTDWDLSLYIQEGLLGEHTAGNVWLCNRMEEDNPQGLTGDDAYVWGAINAAVSKLPMRGVPTNEKVWSPQSYYLSSYWWPYGDSNRGDGLGLFWDNATQPIDSAKNTELRSSFAGKIKYDDYLHAAYAGWKTFDEMKYYQVLYTTPDEGLSLVDIVHVQESNGTTESPYTSMSEEIKSIQDALYMEDSSLGFGDQATVEYKPGPQPKDYYEEARIIGGKSYNRQVIHYKYTDPYDSSTKQVDYTDYYYNNDYITTMDANNKVAPGNTNTVSIGGEGNISILGAEIPGSSMLKVFLKKDSYKSAALGIANKTKNGFGSMGGTSSGSSNSDSSGSPTQISDIFSPGKDENGRYSNPLGIPRLGPALFGGPHGKYASPQTMQAYFDADNPFLQSIARINPAIMDSSSNFTSSDKKTYYSGVEASYMYPAGRGTNQCYIGRSPSETLHLLTSGVCEIQDDYKCTFVTDSGEVPCIGAVFKKATRKKSGGTYKIVLTLKNYIWPDKDPMGNPITYNDGKKDKLAKDIGGMTDWIKVNDDAYKTTQKNGTVVINGHVGDIDDTTHKHYEVQTDSVIAEGKVENNNLYVKLKLKSLPGTWKSETSGTYSRPFLHCIPHYAPKSGINSSTRSESYSHWQIAKYDIKPDPSLTVNGKSYSDYLNAWGSTTKDEVKIAAEYEALLSVTSGMANSNETYYRLTMPYYGDNFKNNMASGQATWYYYANAGNTEHGNGKNTRHNGLLETHETWTDRYTPEDEFVAHMLKNAGSPDSNTWTDIIYCYSDPNDKTSDRANKGPRALVRIPTKLQKIDVTYNLFDGGRINGDANCGKKHKPRCKPCHMDHTHFTSKDKKTYCTFIICDLDKATDFWVSANWNSIYKNDISQADVMTDIPGAKYRVQVNNSVWQILTKGAAPKKFRFAGKGLYDKNDLSGNDGCDYMHGWGMYSALPGFKKITEQTIVENANDCLCFDNQYTNAKNRPLKNFDFKLPIFESAGGKISYADGKYSYVQSASNKKLKYNAGAMSKYDPGMENFLKKMYTSCTLFVQDGSSAKTSLIPFTTDISNCVISALKIVEHQKAYLKFGKELFMNSVESSEVLRIIEKCVDKKIFAASCGSNQDKNSIYYNYWISRAYELYSDSDANTELANAFDSRIASIDTFIQIVDEFMKETNANTIEDITAENWSYNNYIACYRLFSVFKSLCDYTDSAIEEYFYSYLNVLYEYRRFYINKRCNKQDGTLWTCRALESAVPIINGSSNEDSVNLGALVENASLNIESYPIVMKRLSNNLYEKGKAIITSEGLDRDRIVSLYMPCTPATQKDWENFISGKSDEEILKVYKPDPNKENVTYPVYIKKPKDGTYQLISAEYLANKQNKDYNTIIEDLRDSGALSNDGYLAKKRHVNDDIEDCIFPIVWSKNMSDSALQAYLTSSSELKTAAANQENARKAHILAQQKQVEVTEEETKKCQAQLAVVDNWESSVSTSKQCITDYHDYAEPYFYTENDSEKSTTDRRFLKLKQIVDLFEIIDSVGDDNYNDLVSKFMSAYNVTSSRMNELISNNINDSDINFDNDSGFYYGYCVGAYIDVPTTSSIDKAKDTADYKSAFYDNIDEFYDKVSRYIDSKNNLSLYEANLAEAKVEYNKVKTSADEKIMKENTIVSQKLNDYNKSVDAYNEAVERQNERYNAYNNSRKNAGKDNREKNYTWIKSEYPANDALYPTIIFNLVNGIDLSKIDPAANNDPQTTLCGAGNFVDYWCITVPVPPVNIGYDTRLKIKTYETDNIDTAQFSANMATTVAGPFAYNLYPITEDQAGAIAAIAADLTNVDSIIRNTYS